MGLKRVAFMGEAVFPADDARSGSLLGDVVKEALRDGLRVNDGMAAVVVITNMSVDPDPEPVAEDVVPRPSAPEDPVT